MLMAEVHAERLMGGIEPEIRESLTPAQEKAIREAARRNPWQDHSVDLRISLPLPFGSYYVTLVAGREKRSAARLAVDRRKHPMLRLSNIIFVAGTTVFAGALALAVLTAAGVLTL